MAVANARRAPGTAGDGRGGRASARTGSLRVMVVDDEQNIRRTLGMCLRGLGCEVELAATGAAALDALRQRPFDLAFCDLRLEHESGLGLLPQLLAERPGIDVVMITAYASIDSAVEAMRLGARDYLPKPFTPAQIRGLVERTLERRTLAHRLDEVETRLAQETPEVMLETASPRMRSTLQIVERAAAHDVPVLFRGETGSGKGVLAHALHGRSARRDRPFTTVSCAVLPEERLAAELFGQAARTAPGAPGGTAGLVETTEGGTVFLDELAEISLPVQARLVRLLQERRFERVGETGARTADVRLVAATSRDLEAAVKAGLLREDLLYCLAVMEVQVPPLRDRIEDVVPLARSFAAFFARQAQRAAPDLSEATERMLRAWSWPGNVRELRNAVERAIILAPGHVLEPEAFPERMSAHPAGAVTPGGDFTAEEVEREHALRVLARTATLEEASRILDIDVTTLWRKRKRWGR